MPIDEELETLGLGELVCEASHTFHFRFGSWVLAAVSLRARVVGRAFGVGVPLMRPVAVKVYTPAWVRLVRTWKRWLAVLAPQTILSLGVYESVWVDEGDEIEVVVVEKGSYEVVLSVPINQLVGEVFDGHSRDPFSSMSGAMPEDSLVLPLPVLAPEVYALLIAALERLARDECLGVGEGFGEVVQIIKVVGVGVVSVIP